MPATHLKTNSASAYSMSAWWITISEISQLKVPLPFRQWESSNSLAWDGLSTIHALGSTGMFLDMLRCWSSTRSNRGVLFPGLHYLTSHRPRSTWRQNKHRSNNCTVQTTVRWLCYLVKSVSISIFSTQEIPLSKPVNNNAVQCKCLACLSDANYIAVLLERYLAQFFCGENETS